MLSTRNVRLLISAALVATAMLASTSRASAEAKRLNGSACFYESQGNHIAHSRAKQFQNTSGTTQTVICPIVKDNLNGTMIAVIFVSDAVNENSCFLSRRTGNDAVSNFAHTSVTNTVGPLKEVNFLSPIDGTNLATFTVGCTLAGTQRITAFQSSEP